MYYCRLCAQGREYQLFYSQLAPNFAESPSLNFSVSKGFRLHLFTDFINFLRDPGSPKRRGMPLPTPLDLVCTIFSEPASERSWGTCFVVSTIWRLKKIVSTASATFYVVDVHAAYFKVTYIICSIVLHTNASVIHLQPNVPCMAGLLLH